MIIPKYTHAKIIENNFIEAFKAFSSQVVSKYGATWITSKIPFPYLNCVIHNKIPPENTEKTIDEVTKYYQDKSIPFAWFVTDLSSPLDLSQQLRAKGFTAQPTFIGGVFDLAKPFPTFKPHSNCHIEKVTNPDLVHTWGDPIKIAFGFSDEIMKPFIEVMQELMSQKTIVHYMAYDKGKLAGGISTFIGSESVGLYNLGVYPEYRQNKVATSLILEGLILAHALDCQYVVGQGAEYSAKAALSLGFESVMSFTPYLKT